MAVPGTAADCPEPKLPSLDVPAFAAIRQKNEPSHRRITINDPQVFWQAATHVNAGTYATVKTRSCSRLCRGVRMNPVMFLMRAALNSPLTCKN